MEVIAEIGVNHNGDLDLACELVRNCASTGVDYVKFQVFNPRDVVSPAVKLAKYQVDSGVSFNSQFEMLNSLNLSDSEFGVIRNQCDTYGVKFLATPFDLGSLKKVAVWCDRLKIASGDMNNFQLLSAVRELGLPVIFSTGMWSMKEVETTYEFLLGGNLSEDKIAVLHCTSLYPAPFSSLNLSAISTLRDRFKHVGYSDHSIGVEACVGAAALGAELLEKHVTLDTKLSGPDHEASLPIGDLAALVQMVRNISVAIGDGVKAPDFRELQHRKIFSKSIVAVSNIKAGEIFTEQNITTIRGTEGMEASSWKYVLGKRNPGPDLRPGDGVYVD